jgi:Mce-associated membrane protein
VDVTGSGTVQREVSTALGRVLSYDATSPDRTQAAAKELLVGKARQEHATLFASLVERAKDQQLVMDVEVQAAAVQELHDDEATLLVFLDQTSRRSTDREASVAAAQLVVDARRVDGTWKVSGLRVL